jgi:hypothetical protein
MEKPAGYVIRFTDTTHARYFAGVFSARCLGDAKVWKTRKAAIAMLAELTRPAVVVDVRDECASVKVRT